MANNNRRLVLAENGAATTDCFHVRGGRYVWSAEGTFNGGSYQLQYKSPNNTAIDIAGASLSANGALSIEVGADTFVRSVETGTTSAMYQYITAIPNYVKA